MRGYFEIGIFYGKKEVNIGTLWRSAYQLGAAGIFTIGRRYNKQRSDTSHACRHIPLRNYETWNLFLQSKPFSAVLVAIEMGGRPLSQFVHPERAIYILGAEDTGLPPYILKQCQCMVSLESIRQPSFNVAISGSLVMYHRVFHRQKSFYKMVNEQ